MYIVIDTETGGIGLDKSLMSVGLIFADENFEYGKDVFEFFTKPNDGIYHCTADAMSINKINLIEHNTRAITYKQAATEIYYLINSRSNSGKNKLTVVGKNVHFDLTHIWDKLVSRNTWEQFCSYQLLDLSSIWKWLEITEKVPKLPKTSLGDLADHLGVEKGAPHTARGDCITTLNCLKAIHAL